jgi:hypothetical protein
MPTRDQIIVIQCGKRELVTRGLLTEQSYRVLLSNVAGVDSSKLLDNRGVEDVMAVMEGLGFDSHPAGATYWQDKVRQRGHVCGERMVYLIRQLAPQVGRYPLPALVRTFSKQRTEDEARLTPAEAYKLIEMMKATAAREAPAAAAHG